MSSSNPQKVKDILKNVAGKDKIEKLTGITNIGQAIIDQFTGERPLPFGSNSELP